MYIFTHRPPFGGFKQSGAGHGAEIVYVLGTLPPLLFYGMENPARAYRDGRIAREIQTYWTNFAKTGNPNGAGLPPWPAFDDRQQVLDIGDTMKVVELPHPKEYELMDGFMASLRTRQ